MDTGALDRQPVQLIHRGSYTGDLFLWVRGLQYGEFCALVIIYLQCSDQQEMVTTNGAAVYA